MVTKIDELSKQGFKMKVHRFFPAIFEIAKAIRNPDVKEIRMYQTKEVEQGLNPDRYYIFMRK